MNSIIIEQINEHAEEGMVPYTVNLDSISHFRPHITNGVWDGSLVFLKGNTKGIRTKVGYKLLQLNTQSAHEITSMICKLPLEKRQELKAYIANILHEWENSKPTP